MDLNMNQIEVLIIIEMKATAFSIY